MLQMYPVKSIFPDGKEKELWFFPHELHPDFIFKSYIIAGIGVLINIRILEVSGDKETIWVEEAT